MKKIDRYNSAQELANKLKEAGFAVIRVSEPDDVEDGEVAVTDRVHVQVPLSYTSPNVIKEFPGPAFAFGDAQDTFESLVSDLQDAIAGIKERWKED